MEYTLIDRRRHTGLLQKLNSDPSWLSPSHTATPADELRFYDDTELINRDHFARYLKTGAIIGQVPDQAVDTRTARHIDSRTLVRTDARFMAALTHNEMLGDFD